MTTEFNARTYRMDGSPRLTLAQKEEIQERYAKGESLPQLALEFGIRASNLRNWIRPRP